MRRPHTTHATNGHLPVVRSPREALGAAAPVVLVAVGVTVLLSATEVPILSLDPDVVGFLMVIVGLAWLLHRLTTFDQDDGDEGGHDVG